MLLYEREQLLIVLIYLQVTPSASEIPLIYSIQFLVINVLGTDLLLYPPVSRPALLNKV